jgi:hypothetical protein
MQRQQGLLQPETFMWQQGQAGRLLPGNVDCCQSLLLTTLSVLLLCLQVLQRLVGGLA